MHNTNSKAIVRLKLTKGVYNWFLWDYWYLEVQYIVGIYQD